MKTIFLKADKFLMDNMNAIMIICPIVTFLCTIFNILKLTHVI